MATTSASTTARNPKSLPPFPQTGLTDDEFADVLLTVQEASGQLASTVRKARADGIISEKDYADIHRSTVTAIEKLLQLDAELKAQVRVWGTDTDV